MIRVSLTDVHRRHRRGSEVVAAVTGVSFEVAAGRITALVGPSGSGKTTLVNLVLGWDEPDDGIVHRQSEVTFDWTGMAVVPQGLGLLEELTVYENIALPARLGNDQVVTTPAMLSQFNLEGLEGRIPAELSMGERQRTAIARAAAFEALVLVADEPTAHQDEANVLVIATALRSAADRGSAVLLATHDARLLHDVDHLVALRDGRTVTRPSRPAGA